MSSISTHHFSPSPGRFAIASVCRYAVILTRCDPLGDPYHGPWWPSPLEELPLSGPSPERVTVWHHSRCMTRSGRRILKPSTSTGVEAHMRRRNHVSRRFASSLRNAHTITFFWVGMTGFGSTVLVHLSFLFVIVPRPSELPLSLVLLKHKFPEMFLIMSRPTSSR